MESDFSIRLVGVSHYLGSGEDIYEHLLSLIPHDHVGLEWVFVIVEVDVQMGLGHKIGLKREVMVNTGHCKTLRHAH